MYHVYEENNFISGNSHMEIYAAPIVHRDWGGG